MRKMTSIERECYELMGELVNELAKEVKALNDEMEKDVVEEEDCTAELERMSTEAINDFIGALDRYIEGNPGRVMNFGGDTFVSLADIKALAAGR